MNMHILPGKTGHMCICNTSIVYKLNVFCKSRTRAVRAEKSPGTSDVVNKECLLTNTTSELVNLFPDFR